MKIGIFSDTHDRLENVEKALKIFEKNKVRLLIHCGDWVSPFTPFFLDHARGNFNVPIRSVFGNNEGDIKRIFEINSKLKYPIEFARDSTLELEIDGKKIIVYHGHDKTILNAIIKSNVYAVVFTGHTHIVRNETIGKTLVVNPGAVCFVVEGRIAKEASVAIYDSIPNSAQILKFK